MMPHPAKPRRRRRKNVEARITAAYRKIDQNDARQTAAHLARLAAPRPLETTRLVDRIKAQGEVARWHFLSHLQSRLCEEADVCKNLSCRRAKRCRKRLGIAREIQAVERYIEDLSGSS